MSSQSISNRPTLAACIEAWIRLPDQVHQYPLVEWNDGSHYGVHLWINTAGGFGFVGSGCLYANLRDTGNSDRAFVSPTGLISTGDWQHVALTYDRSSGI